MSRFKNRQEEREYEESIKGDVMDFMKELGGIKKPEFPIGDTKEWRKEKEEKKGRKYDETDNRDTD